MSSRPRPIFPQRSKTEERLLRAASILIKSSALALLLIWASGKVANNTTPATELPSLRGPSALIIMGKKGSVFEGVKLNKGTGFPELYQTKDEKHYKLPAADVAAWCKRLNTWSAAQGAPFLLEFATILAPVNADATQRMRIFPANQTAWDSIDTLEAKKAFLKIVHTSKLGKHLLACTEAELAAMSDARVQTECLGVFQLASEIGFRIQMAAQPPGYTSTLYPDILDATSGPAYDKGDLYVLAGFVQLNQLTTKLSMDAQGTTLQMKAALISRIQAKSSEKHVQIWDIAPFLDHISPNVANISNREPAAKALLEQEVNSAALDFICEVCKTAGQNKQLPKLESMAADRIYFQLSSAIQQYRILSWQDFHSAMSNILIRTLPTRNLEDNTSRKRKEPEDNSLALNAQSKKQNTGVPKSEIEKNWTCAKCAGKGHFPRNCRNKPNPQGPAKAAQARDRALAEREKRDKQSAQKTPPEDR